MGNSDRPHTQKQNINMGQRFQRGKNRRKDVWCLLGIRRENSTTKRNQAIPKNLLSPTQKSQIPKEEIANRKTQEQKGLSFVG